MNGCLEPDPSSHHPPSEEQSSQSTSSSICELVYKPKNNKEKRTRPSATLGNSRMEGGGHYPIDAQHEIASHPNCDQTMVVRDLLHLQTSDSSQKVLKSLKKMLVERFLNSARGELHLYYIPAQTEGSKSDTILNPSPSVSLRIPDVGQTRYFSTSIHLDRAQFAGVIPNNECLIAAIPEFHSFPEQTLPDNKFYKIKLEHCLKSAEERKMLIVRQGFLRTRNTFQEIHYLPQAKKDAAFYEVDEHYITIYTHHFTEFICTVCNKVCEQRARLLIFGSLNHVNDSTKVTVRPYMCSSLHSIDIFRKRLVDVEKACRRVLLEEGDVDLPLDILYYRKYPIRFSLTPVTQDWELLCPTNFQTDPPGTFTRVRKIGDMFDSQKCHLCSQNKPYEICTYYLKHVGSNVVPFEGNAAITISIPKQSRESIADEDTDVDTDTIDDVTEFNISIQESPALPSAEYKELNEDEQLFLRGAAGCISDDDKLWDIGVLLGAVDNEIKQIRADNPKSIKQSAFKMLLFCCEKKKCTWEEFHSKLQSAFQRNNMANEFEKLSVL